MTQKDPQLASTVLMIRPVRFHSNPEAATSNAFMHTVDWSADEEQAIAAGEFEGIADELRSAGVNVVVVDDTPEPETPDSIFPNNWMSTHADGTLVLYPMEVPNRRPERRSDIVAILQAEGFEVSDIVDLSGHEARDAFLEGTGSLVLDRVNRVAYACLAARTHPVVLQDFARRLGYDVVTFTAADPAGVPIYHTNVMMNVGKDFAVVCLECIVSGEERAAVVRSLEATGHEIIPISFEQVLSMAGNMLEITALNGDRLVAMSSQARASLDDEQVARIESRARIVSAPIDNIENSAGGSVRCMLAEIHLPMKDAHDQSDKA